MPLDRVMRASRRSVYVVAAVALVAVGAGLFAQGPPPGGPAPAGPAAAGGRGGRGGGLPGATPEQTQAVAAMNTALTESTAAVTAARLALTQATFASPKDAAAIGGAVDKLRAAELALAMKRAEEFAKLQSGPNKLNADQVTALVAQAGNAGGAGRGAPAAPPPQGPGRGAPGAPMGPGRGN